MPNQIAAEFYEFSVDTQGTKELRFFPSKKTFVEHHLKFFRDHAELRGEIMFLQHISESMLQNVFNQFLASVLFLYPRNILCLNIRHIFIFVNCLIT